MLIIIMIVKVRYKPWICVFTPDNMNERTNEVSIVLNYRIPSMWWEKKRSDTYYMHTIVYTYIKTVTISTANENDPWIKSCPFKYVPRLQNCMRAHNQTCQLTKRVSMFSVLFLSSVNHFIMCVKRLFTEDLVTFGPSQISISRLSQVHPQGLWKLSWLHFFKCSQKLRTAVYSGRFYDSWRFLRDHDILGVGMKYSVLVWMLFEYSSSTSSYLQVCGTALQVHWMIELVGTVDEYVGQWVGGE